MPDPKEKSLVKPAETDFTSINISPVNQGDKQAKISGKLIREDTQSGVENAKVHIALAQGGAKAVDVTTDANGKFEGKIDVSNLLAGKHTIDLLYDGGTASVPGSDIPQILEPQKTHKDFTIDSQTEAPINAPPASDQPGDDDDATAPCNTPGGLMTAVNRLLRDPNVTVGVGDFLRDAASKSQDTARKDTLNRIASAITGSDAVAADGEPCRGQLFVEMFLTDPVTGKKEHIKEELLRRLRFQIVDQDLNLATSYMTVERHGIKFDRVETGTVVVALSSEIAEGVELSYDYKVTDPGDSTFVSRKRSKNSAASGTSPNQNQDQNQKHKQKNVNPKSLQPQGQSSSTETLGFQATIKRGLRTRMQLFLDPPTAFVRCFASLQGPVESCACANCAQESSSTKSDGLCRYISQICISAMRGETLVSSVPTGADGCAGFTLNPGWYTFFAPEDVTIEGCNFELSSSSPISAFVGAGQSCSDVVFCYRKKGCEILVDAVVSHPETDNPQETATENLPAMQYLLLRENDPTFVQQQYSASGEAVHFRNLAAGTYWLFSQAPATFGSQPIRPAGPDDARLTLSVFAGQVGAVPVEPHFVTTNNNSAILDGHVRDDSGFAIPGQVVQVKNCDGYVIAADVTDATGYYSLRVYEAEDLQIVVGSQSQKVAKGLLLAQIQPIGPDPVPFAQKTINRALQASELLGV